MATIAACFDLGNVIFRYDNKALADILASRLGVRRQGLGRAMFGLHPQAPIIECLEGRATTEEYLQAVARDVGIAAVPYEDFRAALEATTTIDEDARALVERLRRKDTLLAAISNIEAFRHEWLKEKRVLDLFHVQVLSFIEHVRKPNEEMFVRAIDGLGVRAEDAVFCDDDPDNVAAAADVGLDALLFVDVGTLERQLVDRGLL